MAIGAGVRNRSPETRLVIGDCSLMIDLGAIAQLGERRPCKAEVTGSIPVSSTRRLSERAVFETARWYRALFFDNMNTRVKIIAGAIRRELELKTTYCNELGFWSSYEGHMVDA